VIKQLAQVKQQTSHTDSRLGKHKYEMMKKNTGQLHFLTFAETFAEFKL